MAQYKIHWALFFHRHTAFRSLSEICSCGSDDNPVRQNEALGVLMAATIGVPLYACGGGTIPLLQQWLWDGMSVGSAASFMLTGPSTKITNLGALKIVLGMKRFLLYLAYVMVFSFITGLVVNLIV